ncbi:MAG TPA: WYL domain-containing protein [Acidimicrobiia bacterium]|nr:WYL domain-containing protein [Acidimicrobiia bacterium]
MRADRLVATLLFLQARGRVTAAEVAAELEVSVKTARRDLEALSIAGIPVYSQAGRGGGSALVGGARTDLSGLTAAEARTLFLVAGPSSAITPAAKAALRKLVRALPETFRAEAEKAASAIVLDPARWGGKAPSTPPHLEALQHAVIEGVQIRLGYTDARGSVTERMVHPLGLVSKGTTWYLVGDTDAGRRTFRVWRVRSVELTEEPAVRPPDFDLQRAWNEIVATLDERRGLRHVHALADPQAVKWLRAQFGTRVIFGEAEPDGRIDVDIAFPATHEDPARELAAYADSLEVLDPEVRARMAEFGRMLATRHAG